MEKIYKSVPDVEALRYKGTPDKPDIKIFVSHRIDLDSETIDNPLYIPVRCGAVYDERNDVTMLGDNTGDNISEKRGSFCELTVQYWAWKNIKADYYGLCHYRRYLSFSTQNLAKDVWGNITYDFLDKNAIAELNLFREPMQDLVQKYDFIISTPYKTRHSVYEQYKETPALHIEDLDHCIDIIARISPEYLDAANRYLHGKKFYPCCLFIMKQELFNKYSKWLFSILDKFEEEADCSNYGSEAYRTAGHLGERLLGVFYTYIQMKHPQYKTLVLQRAIFWNTEKNKLPVPAFLSNNIPVVLTSSDYYVPYAAATLLSLIKKSSPKYNYDITFLYSNISDSNKKLLQRMIEKLPNFSLQLYHITPLLSEYAFKANNHVSVETFYRLFVQTIFKNYKKILYLDSDLIIKRDIADLYNIDIGNNLIGAAPDADWMSQYNGAIPSVRSYCNKILKLDNPFTYFQAGVMIFNIEEMNKTFTETELADFGSSREFMYVDQDVLNSKCQGRVYLFDIAWNVMTSCGGQRTKNIDLFAPRHIAQQYSKAREKPYIIHYAGYLKPWNNPSEDFAEEFWECVRGCFLYEILLSRMGADVSWHTTADYINYQSARGVKAKITSFIKRVSYVFLPLGSRRRQKAKMLYCKLKGLI